jgi:hypothetical protein
LHPIADARAEHRQLAMKLRFAGVVRDHDDVDRVAAVTVSAVRAESPTLHEMTRRREQLVQRIEPRFVGTDEEHART